MTGTGGCYLFYHVRTGIYSVTQTILVDVTDADRPLSGGAKNDLDSQILEVLVDGSENVAVQHFVGEQSDQTHAPTTSDAILRPIGSPVSALGPGTTITNDTGLSSPSQTT